jgi:hypothetical protein
VSPNDLDTTLRNLRSQALRCYVFVTYLRDLKEFGEGGEKKECRLVSSLRVKLDAAWLKLEENLPLNGGIK